MVAFHPLRREAGGGDHTLILYLLDAAEDQLLLHRLRVELLHDARGLVLGQASYLLEDGSRILVPRLYPFEVQDGEATQTPDEACCLGVYGGVERTR